MQIEKEEQQTSTTFLQPSVIINSKGYCVYSTKTRPEQKPISLKI